MHVCRLQDRLHETEGLQQIGKSTGTPVSSIVYMYVEVARNNNLISESRYDLEKLGEFSKKLLRGCFCARPIDDDIDNSGGCGTKRTAKYFERTRFHVERDSFCCK